MVMKKYVVMAKDGVALFDSVPEWALAPQFRVVCVDVSEEQKGGAIESWPIPTDEDARWRPQVMVRDYDKEEWSGPEILACVNPELEYGFVDIDGTKWIQCCISPEEKARCDYLNKKLDS
jgi:hypothetical protein